MSQHLIQIEIPEGDSCAKCVFCDGEYADCNNPHRKANTDGIDRPQWCHDAYDPPQHWACAHTVPDCYSEAILKDRFYCALCGKRLTWDEIEQARRHRQ